MFLRSELTRFFQNEVLRTTSFCILIFVPYNIGRAAFISLLITDAPGEHKIADMPTLVGDFGVITHDFLGD